MASDARAAEVEWVMQRVAQWARTQPDIRALLLVGSWARDAAQPDSDVDLVVLTTTPECYSPDGAWIRELGAVAISRVQQWGAIAERRIVLSSGLAACRREAYQTCFSHDRGQKRIGGPFLSLKTTLRCTISRQNMFSPTDC